MGKIGALTKDNPARHQRDASIAQMRLQGETYAEIAKAHGIDIATVSRVLNDDEIREIITQGTRQAVSMVPKAIDNYRQLLDDPDSKIRKDTSKDVLTLTGIMPSHTQSIVITNSFNKQSIEFTPEVVSLLAHANGSATVPALGLPDIVEAEYDNASNDDTTTGE